MNQISSIEQAEPHSVEAEQQVLGHVLLNNDLYHSISSVLAADHFFDPVHSRIWQIASDRIAKDHLASPVTMAQDLQSDEGLADLGGAVYLARLCGSAISAGSISDYARMVSDLSAKRRILRAVRGSADALVGGADIGEVVAELELMLHETQDASDVPRSMSLLRAHTESLAQMQEVYEGRSVSIPTGLTELDERLILAPQRYTILGGSTSMGKSALALHLAYAAAKAGFGVGFVSLEMPEVDLARRFASIESQIHYKAMDRAMSEATFRTVIDAMKAQDALPVEIFGNTVRDVPAILSEGRRLQRKWKPNGDFRGFKLLVVDYLQLVRGKGESAFVRLSQVANDMKQVAKMLDVHVLALAQVDRALGGSDSHEVARPRLSNLRGSGDLENAPDNVLFIHRPEYFYERQTPPKKDDERADWEAEYADWKGKAEIIIGKARMGEIGSVVVGCEMGTNRFFDLQDRVDPQMGYDF